MHHESPETRHHHVQPIAMANETETPNENRLMRNRPLLDSLVFIYLLGFTIAHLAIEPRAVASPPVLAPIPTFEETRTGGISFANATKMIENTHPLLENETFGTNMNELDTLDLSPRVHTVSFGNAHGPPKERRQAAAQFDEFEAMVSIDKAAQQAKVCLGANDPRPVMRVAVTFSTSGRVKRSEVETGPYQNTSQGECIARVLRSASVKPFDGSAVTVHRAVQIR